MWCKYIKSVYLLLCSLSLLSVSLAYFAKFYRRLVKGHLRNVCLIYTIPACEFPSLAIVSVNTKSCAVQR